MQDASQDDFPLNAADHALAQASTATDLDATDLSNCWQMLPVGQGVAQAANAEVLATSVSQQGGNNDGEEEGDEVGEQHQQQQHHPFPDASEVCLDCIIATAKVLIGSEGITGLAGVNCMTAFDHSNQPWPTKSHASECAGDCVRFDRRSNSYKHNPRCHHHHHCPNALPEKTQAMSKADYAKLKHSVGSAYKRRAK